MFIPQSLLNQACSAFWPNSLIPVNDNDVAAIIHMYSQIANELHHNL